MFNDANNIEDFNALQALFTSTGGNNWDTRSNWGSSSVSLDAWYGVETDPTTGRVTRLDLSNNNLTGNIPEDLDDLEFLTYLNLSENMLEGEIPAALEKLSDLDTLLLRDNSLTGFTASFDVNNMDVLAIEDNALDFTDLFKLTNRGSLSAFTYSPQDTLEVENSNIGVTLGASIILTSSDNSSGNTYEWFKDDDPTVIATTSDLEILNFVIGDAGEYSAIIGNPSFGALDLHVKPVVLFTNTAPTDIVLSNNSIVELLPAGTVVGILSTVDADNANSDEHTYSVVIGATNFEIVEDTLKSRRSFDYTLDQSLDLKIKSEDSGGESVEVEFTITIEDLLAVNDPAVYVALQKLAEALGIDSWTNSDNWLDASVPFEDWYGLEVDNNGNIISITLADNNLLGVMPPEVLSTFTELQTLIISGNLGVTGEIPSLVSLDDLINLDLSRNSLTGGLPTFSPTKSIQNIDLSDNSLDGALDALSILTNLDSIDLGGNDFEGEIPDFSALAMLTALDLDNNNFTGTFPQLSASVSLQSLDLSGNELSGAIPKFNVEENAEIKLNGNGFTSIDADIANGTTPGVFDVSNNGFDFTDLVPLSAVLTSYNPQTPDYESQNYDVAGQQDLTLAVSDVAPGNVYRWYKNGSVDPSLGSESTTQINDFEVRSVNEYYAEITNPSLPGLLIQSQLMTVKIISSNSAPSNITPVSFKILEGSAVGTKVGTFSIDDSDIAFGDTHTYKIEPESSQFELDGDELVTKVELDAEIQDIYTISVTVTDYRGLSTQAAIEIEVVALSPLNSQVEYDALEQFYNEAQGADWTYNSNWLNPESEFKFWHGVSTNVDGRVIGIDLNGNNLSGVISASLNNLNLLTEVNLASNKLSEIAVGLDVTTFTGLNLEDNMFLFDDLTPYVSNLNVSFIPQSKIGEADNILLNEGYSYTLSTIDVSLDDRYRWYKDGGEIIGEISSTLDLAGVTSADAGLYYTEIESNSVPGLILQSNPVTIVLNSAPTGLTLEGNTVLEGAPIGTTIGTFTTEDEDSQLGDNYTYSIMSGNNNDIFKIVENTLVTNIEFSYSVQTVYNINVRTTDGAGLYIDNNFDIEILQLDESNNIDDYEALVDLYNSTGGSSWIMNSNWTKSDVSLDTWEGIETDPVTGRVTSIELPLNNLVGTLPNSLSKLTSLEVLILGNNSLEGEIPISLGLLSSLRDLRLNDNLFTSFEIGLDLLNLSGSNQRFNVERKPSHHS